jgi:putative addiction module CopG family antidote
MAVQNFSITLTQPMADAIRTRVECGDYANASEVIREAVRLWMHKEVAADAGFCEQRALPSDTTMRHHD